MDSNLKRYADAGLAAAVRPKLVAGGIFDAGGSPGSFFRITWEADWGAGRVTFSLIPTGFPDDFFEKDPLRWSLPLDDHCLLPELGPDSFECRFREAFPDPAVRAPYVFRGEGAAA